jgi:hypothetical protein
MATIKANNSSYLLLGDKITTPSLVIHKAGYIPLFKGNKNATVDYNRYRYTLGGLKVGDYRAAVSRTFINHSPTVTVGASSNKIANGSSVTITAYASDPDGDTLSYEWNTGATSSSISVSASNTTNYYNCTVSDPYGGRATSNTVSVTWYNPNTAPIVKITSVTPNPSTDGKVTVNFQIYDAEGGLMEYWVGYTAYGSGGSEYDNPVIHKYTGLSAKETETFSSKISASLRYPPNTGGVNNEYYCYVTVKDPSGAKSTDRYRVAKSNGSWSANYWVYDTKTDMSTGSYHSSKTYTYQTTLMTGWPSQMTGTFFTVARIGGNNTYYDIGDRSAGEGSGIVYAVKASSDTKVFTKSLTETIVGSHATVYGSTYEYGRTWIDAYIPNTDVTFIVQAQKDVNYSYTKQNTGKFA